MTNARLRLAFAGESSFPPRAPFLEAWGNLPGFPTPLHAHESTEVAP